MRLHSFDAGVATKHGVHAAVIIQHFLFWCEKNKADGRHEHDGKYWTYTSRKALREHFPYMTDSQIRTATQKLVDDGLLEVGNFNANGYDRTLWYCVTDKAIEEHYGVSALLESQIHLSKIANGCVGIRKPIPDIYPDNIPDIPPISPKGDTPPQNEDMFSVFWKAYPRKEAKVVAERAFKKAHISDLAPVLADIERRKKTDEWKKDKGKFIPHPATYLNQRRWEDEVPGSLSGGAPDPEPHYRYFDLDELEGD